MNWNLESRVADPRYKSNGKGERSQLLKEEVWPVCPAIIIEIGIDYSSTGVPSKKRDS